MFFNQRMFVWMCFCFFWFVFLTWRFWSWSKGWSVFLSSGGGSSSVVGGRAGHNVTLTCKYNSRSHGKLSACWGRGDIPLSGCSHQIISTDGLKVKEETRVSSRYQLLGRLEDGDVSLTVLNVTEEDAGVYGCRVEKHGWFNDQKHYISLNIEEGGICLNWKDETDFRPDRCH